MRSLTRTARRGGIYQHATQALIRATMLLPLAGCPNSDSDHSCDAAYKIRDEEPSTLNFAGQVIIPVDHQGVEPRALPLVLLLHGMSANPQPGRDALSFAGIDQAFADQEGAVIVAPDGTLGADANAYHYWNATDACCAYEGLPQIDHILELNRVINDVAQQVESGGDFIAARRVFVVGWSAGAFMAHAMACDPDSKIAGIVSVNGAGWKEPPATCGSVTNVALLHVHSRNDPTVHFDGGVLQNNWPPMEVHASAPEVFALWSDKNGCVGDPLIEEGRCFGDGGFRRTYQRQSYSQCETMTELWAHESADHTSGQGPPTRDFIRQVLNTTCTGRSLAGNAR